MKTAVPIVLLLFALILMEAAAWVIFKASNSEVGSSAALPAAVQERGIEGGAFVESEQKTEPAANPSPPVRPNIVSQGSDEGSFPLPTTETVNGRTERTIHMGVRQYAWEPALITAERGELVRLIVHNADVKHGLAIPELGVSQDIPPDGAVVEFIASKSGTFEFFCSVWCGERHMGMRGSIVIR